MKARSHPSEAPVVMIVDDNVRSLENISKLLSTTGMHTLTYVTAADALSALGQRRIDLAVLDIHFGDDPQNRTGLQIAEVIREQDKSIPIVAFSALYPHDDLSSEELALFDRWYGKGESSLSDLREFLQTCVQDAQRHFDSKKPNDPADEQ